MLYVIAERLGRRIPEMSDLTIEEYIGWIAFYKVRATKK